MIFSILVPLLFIGANGQQSLQEMIERLRQESGHVYDTPSSTPPPLQYPSVEQLLASATNLDTRFDTETSNQIAASILNLGQQIGTKLAQQRSEKTQVFSPISIAGALSLLLLGANGRTLNELMHLFGFDQEPVFRANPYKIHEQFGLLLEDLISTEPNPNRPRQLSPWKYMPIHESRRNNDRAAVPSDYHLISVANGLFVQNGFSLRPDYRTAVESVYQSKIVNLDFRGNSAAATNYINQWVSEQTHGKIHDILGGEIQPQTNLIVASALYFKALWDKTFIEGATNTKNFFPDGVQSNPIPVEMMAHGGVFPFYDAKEYDCRILGFPYKGNLSTMYVILPNDSNRQKVKQMQATLTAEKIEHMISKMTLKTAVILFPKLHIQNTVNLKQIVNHLGVSTLFNYDQSDLSLISSGRVETFTGPQFSRPVVTPAQNAPGIYDRPILVPHRQSTNGPVQTPVNLNGRNDTVALHVQNYQESLVADANDKPFIFSRFNEEESATGSPNATLSRQRRTVKYKVESSFRRNIEPLRLKDFIINKRITKSNPGKKLYRNRRQANGHNVYNIADSIKNLDGLRNGPLSNPRLYAEEIVHKIDLTINERGTEGGAATVVYLTRTGTDVVFRVETPFIFLIRHDATKIPLFYGTVNEPTNF